LRPTIQIEINLAKLRAPSTNLPISSFVAEAFGRSPELASMPCVSVIEIAAEKLVSLTRRTAMETAGLSRAPDPNLVRHIHDLHAIQQRIDHAAVAAMARDIAISDAEEFANQYPAYLADISGETRKALAALQTNPVIRQHYDTFAEVMVYGQRFGFDKAMQTIVALVNGPWPDRAHSR
jgi:Nucleotidyl transferase AbiEii toxin, Type IV TA system